MDRDLLNDILKNIKQFKHSKECSKFIKQVSENSKLFHDTILENASIKPEVLKMRIGV